MALCIDIPETLDRNKAVDAVEGIIQAYQVHLVSLRGAEDSRAVTRINGLPPHIGGDQSGRCPAHGSHLDRGGCQYAG